MRIFKRLILIVAILLVLAAGGVGYAYYLSNSQPAGYTPNMLTAEQQAVARVEMNHKVESLDILANESQVWARSQLLAAQGKPLAQPVAKPAPVTQTFAQDQLNVYLTQWWIGDIKTKGDAYMKDPFIRLEADTIIFMGMVPEYQKVISVYFEPRIDSEGMLRCDMTSVRLGSLPLPDALFAKHRDKLIAQVRAKLPALQGEATLDESGVANNAAGQAALSRLLLSSIDQRPMPAALFMPRGDGAKQLPVRLTGVKVAEGQLTLTAAPLELPEIATLRTKIKEPYNVQQATADVGAKKG